MKLVGNIKDYYDGAASQFGYSDDVIYNRTRVEIIGSKDIPESALSIHKCSVTIGFCGKIYYGYVPSFFPYTNNKIHYPYFQKDVDAVLELYSKEKERLGKRSWNIGRNIEAFAASCGFIKRSWWQIGGENVGSGYLDSVENHNVFTTLGCPAFSITYVSDTTPVLTKNPILKDFDFGRLVDPYTAVQELEMYLGRLATNNTPKMPVGSDKVIAESKGFDKWSFRKLPE